MERATAPFRRTTAALVLTNLLGAVAACYCLVSARQAASHGDHTFVALSDDVTRASQAQVAAERMVAVGRVYLLSAEPELVLRAQAADAKLTRTLALLEQGIVDREERHRLDDVKEAAGDYRSIFADLLSDTAMRGDPRLVASALRKRLIPARERLLSELDQLVARRQSTLSAERALAREASRRWLIGFVILGIVEVGLSLLLVWYLFSALHIVEARVSELDHRRRAELERRRFESGSRGARTRRMTRPFA